MLQGQMMALSFKLFAKTGPGQGQVLNFIFLQKILKTSADNGCNQTDDEKPLFAGFAGTISRFTRIERGRTWKDSSDSCQRESEQNIWSQFSQRSPFLPGKQYKQVRIRLNLFPSQQNVKHCKNSTNSSNRTTCTNCTNAIQTTQNLYQLHKIVQTSQNINYNCTHTCTNSINTKKEQGAHNCNKSKNLTKYTN